MLGWLLSAAFAFSVGMFRKHRERRRIRERPAERVVEVGEPLAMLGRDRDRLAEPKLVGFEHAGRSCPALALVGDHDGGLAGSAHKIGKNSIFRHRACARIDQEQYCIGGSKRGLGLLLHAPGQAFGRGRLEARGVDHGELKIAEPRAALAPVAGDAGAVVDQCEAFADEAVEQRRLADIRPSDNGDREAHDRGSSGFTRALKRAATLRIRCMPGGDDKRNQR